MKAKKVQGIRFRVSALIESIEAKRRAAIAEYEAKVVAFNDAAIKRLTEAIAAFKKEIANRRKKVLPPRDFTSIFNTYVSIPARPRFDSYDKTLAILKLVDGDTVTLDDDDLSRLIHSIL